MMLNLTAPDRKPGQGAIGLVLNPTNRDGKGLRFRLAEVSVEPPVHNESCSRYKHAESMLACRLQTRRPINRVLLFFLAAGVPQTRRDCILLSWLLMTSAQSHQNSRPTL